MEDNITYHDKDILLKNLAERYPNEFIQFFGLGFSQVEKTAGNEYPKIEVSGLRSDSVFKFKDSSVLVLEYESKYNKESDSIKYLNYVTNILSKRS